MQETIWGIQMLVFAGTGSQCGVRNALVIYACARADVRCYQREKYEYLDSIEDEKPVQSG